MVLWPDLQLVGLFEIFFSIKCRHLSYHGHSSNLRSQSRLRRIAESVIQTLKRISSIEYFLRALMFHGEYGFDTMSDLFVSLSCFSSRLILLVTLLLSNLFLVFEAHIHIFGCFPGYYWPLKISLGGYLLKA